MNTTELVPATSDAEIQDIANLANIIWHEHFTGIISEAQIDYMVEKFQSYPALKEQIQEGYEYFQIYSGHTLVGFTGVHDEDDKLFLSKLYIEKNARGQHISTQAFHFLIDLCKERGLKSIWLTCNKYNENSLNVYHHWGFVITREQKADIGNGFYMDDYIMEYTI